MTKAGLKLIVLLPHVLGAEILGIPHNAWLRTFPLLFFVQSKNTTYLTTSLSQEWFIWNFTYNYVYGETQ